MVKALLTVHKLACPYIRLTVLSPLTFSLKKGEVLYVIGSNGSGKSTLLSLVAGVFPLGRDDIKSAPSFYCGHETGLKASLTVQENLYFRCEIFGNFLKGNVDKTLEILGLEALKARRVGTLSQGQKQQVAMASAILSKKPLWILDEPFVNLDSMAKTSLQKAIDDHLEKGGAALIATHGPVSGKVLTLD